MYIYILSTLLLILFVFLPQKIGINFSRVLILFQLLIMGRVGGDYDSYAWRGEYALENPEKVILNEPFTVIFSNLSVITYIPLHNFYIVLTTIIILFSIRKSQNRYIYIFVYTIFIIPICIGYLRQALSIAMIILAISTQSNMVRIINIIGAIIAHQAAIFPIFLYYIGKLDKNIIKKYWWKLIIICIGVYLYTEPAIGHYIKYYHLESIMQSKGYLIRLLLFSLITLILSLGINVKDKFKLENQKILILNYVIIIFSLILFFISGSTAADRILLYIMPFTILLFSYQAENIKNLLITTISITYFMGWLNFSPNARSNWNYITLFN